MMTHKGVSKQAVGGWGPDCAKAQDADLSCVGGNLGSTRDREGGNQAPEAGKAPSCTPGGSPSPTQEQRGASAQAALGLESARPPWPWASGHWTAAHQALHGHLPKHAWFFASALHGSPHFIRNLRLREVEKSDQRHTAEQDSNPGQPWHRRGETGLRRGSLCVRVCVCVSTRVHVWMSAECVCLCHCVWPLELKVVVSGETQAEGRHSEPANVLEEAKDTGCLSRGGGAPGASRAALCPARRHDEVTGQNLKLPTPTAPPMGGPTERPQPCRQHSPLEPSAP